MQQSLGYGCVLLQRMRPFIPYSSEGKRRGGATAHGLVEGACPQPGARGKGTGGEKPLEYIMGDTSDKSTERNAMERELGVRRPFAGGQALATAPRTAGMQERALESGDCECNAV